PTGQNIGDGMRFTGAATQMLFVPSTRVFVAASTGSTGLPGGGPGLIGGRTADGEPLGDPFPIVTPAAGARLAASDAGDVYVGTTSGGAFDMEVFRPRAARGRTTSRHGPARGSPRRDRPAPRLRSGGRHGRGARSRRDDQRRHHVARRPRRRGHRGLEEGRTLHLALSQPERVRSMVPLEILPLPRPLDRFGSAFPSSLADLYANAYTPRRGVVLDPLAHPWSAADAAERADRRGVAKSREP